jgi:hypothetical protein
MESSIVLHKVGDLIESILYSLCFCFCVSATAYCQLLNERSPFMVFSEYLRATPERQLHLTESVENANVCSSSIVQLAPYKEVAALSG